MGQVAGKLIEGEKEEELLEAAARGRGKSRRGGKRGKLRRET